MSKPASSSFSSSKPSSLFSSCGTYCKLGIATLAALAAVALGSYYYGTSQKRQPPRKKSKASQQKPPRQRKLSEADLLKKILACQKVISEDFQLGEEEKKLHNELILLNPASLSQETRYRAAEFIVAYHDLKTLRASGSKDEWAAYAWSDEVRSAMTFAWRCLENITSVPQASPTSTSSSTEFSIDADMHRKIQIYLLNIAMHLMDAVKIAQVLRFFSALPVKELNTDELISCSTAAPSAGMWSFTKAIGDELSARLPEYIEATLQAFAQQMPWILDFKIAYDLSPAMTDVTDLSRVCWAYYDVVDISYHLVSVHCDDDELASKLRSDFEEERKKKMEANKADAPTVRFYRSGCVAQVCSPLAPVRMNVLGPVDDTKYSITLVGASEIADTGVVRREEYTLNKSKMTDEMAEDKLETWSGQVFVKEELRTKQYVLEISMSLTLREIKRHPQRHS